MVALTNSDQTIKWYRGNIGQELIYFRIMVDLTQNHESRLEELREKLEEREQSPSPDVDEWLPELAGDLFLQLVREHRSALGDDFTGDRDRGILSPDDRDYLWQQSDYEYEQSKYSARERIRNRTRNAILDFTDLEFTLEEEDRERIFASLSGNLEDHLVMAVRFFYQGLDYEADRLEAVVEQAVHEAENRRSVQQGQAYLHSVDVSIDVNRSPGLEHIQTKLEAGDPLTDRELGVLVRAGELPAGQLDELADSSREQTLERILKQRREESD